MSDGCTHTHTERANLLLPSFINSRPYSLCVLAPFLTLIGFIAVRCSLNTIETTFLIKRSRWRQINSLKCRLNFLISRLRHKTQLLDYAKFSGNQGAC